MDHKTTTLMSSGEHELDLCNFSAAYDAFKKAAERSQDPLAYFGMAVAKFEISYIKDMSVSPAIRIPSFHNISEERGAFADCDEYKKAFSLADPAQQSAFRTQALDIDLIREEFFDLQEDGMGYDVFISAKAAREDGSETDDAKEAQKLYDHFVQRGLRPYLSRQDKDLKEGSTNEALTFYALTSAPCMVVVCLDKKNLEDPCVTSEYMRFENMMMRTSEGKEPDSLIVLSKDLTAKDKGRLHFGGETDILDISDADAYDELDKFADEHVFGFESDPKMSMMEQELRRVKQEEHDQKTAEHRERSAQRRTAAKNRAAIRNRRAKEATSAFFGKIKDGAPDFFRGVGHVLSMPFVGIGRWFGSWDERVIIGTHIISLLLSLAGLLFMYAYPFARPLLPHTPAYALYIAITVLFTLLILVHFVYCTVKSEDTKGHILFSGLAAFVVGLLAVICFCIGWYTNNMHAWIWVFFAFSMAAFLFFAVTSLIANFEDEPDMTLCYVEELLFGFAVLSVLGGWLYVKQFIFNYMLLQ